MHILKGNYRNEQGHLERASLMVESANGGFRDVETGEVYKAQEYKAGDATATEIIAKGIDTDAVYTAFVPDAGECERIGMPVVRLETAATAAYQAGWNFAKHIIDDAQNFQEGPGRFGHDDEIPDGDYVDVKSRFGAWTVEMEAEYRRGYNDAVDSQ